MTKDELSEKDYKIALEEYEKTHKPEAKPADPTVPKKPIPPSNPPKDEDKDKGKEGDTGDDEEDEEGKDKNPEGGEEKPTKEEFEKKLAAMKGDELIALADTNKIVIDGLKTKAEIAAKIVAELYK